MWDTTQCACVCDLVCLAIYSIGDDCTCRPIEGLECDPQYNGEFDEEFGCKEKFLDEDMDTAVDSGAKYIDLCAATISAAALMLSLQ